ncbi:MAG: translation elongation factor Ts [Bauldia sp.]|jgi:elongation factor Ts
MTISAASVKELRDKTGAGMMDCKAALTETGGNMEAAIDWLRAKGLSKAAKKAGRVAAEGLIGVASKGTEAVVVEVNSETDFVARNTQFQDLVRNVADVALATTGATDAVKAAAFPGTGRTVEREIQEAVATIGENITLRRTDKLSVTDGVVASYVHNQVAPNLGKIGVLVALQSTGDKAKLNALGRQVAMHVAATNPLSLNVADLDKDVVARERGVYAEQARESGKPEAIIEKMVDGRMRKFYEETVLVAQKFTMNTDLTVEAAIKAAEADVGAPITLTAFRMFKLGDGIEKAETDFAAEVAAAAGAKH